MGGYGQFQDASGVGIDAIDVLKRVTIYRFRCRRARSCHITFGMRYDAFTELSQVHLSVAVDVQKAGIDPVWKPVADFLGRRALRR